LQGEGQEFESPRLHHLAGQTDNTKSSGSAPRTIAIRFLDPLVRVAIAPLIRALIAKVTDQWIAGRGSTSVESREAPAPWAGAHLNNWNSVSAD
jgi:hypothetical protein